MRNSKKLKIKIQIYLNNRRKVGLFLEKKLSIFYKICQSGVQIQGKNELKLSN